MTETHPQYIRRNVWKLGGWTDTILWYARGVRALQNRALADPTGWRFYAAIHGIDRALWVDAGYLDLSEAPPALAAQRLFWNQCQHGGWYFLPWHRGYLLGFEQTVRAAVISLGGPEDWALPYWNYLRSGEAELPTAFASPDWPDGTDDNPLFVRRRYGPPGEDVLQRPWTDFLDEFALGEPLFTGPGGGASTGFGGVATRFEHSGQARGGVESQPHNTVHGLVGWNSKPDQSGTRGLMSDPRAAALDPIFWLHHANIDRLWEVWRTHPPAPAHLDPTNPDWLAGPASTGQQEFAVPLPTGQPWIFTPEEVSDLASLGYVYDDLEPDTTVPQRSDRLARLGVAALAVPSDRAVREEAVMASDGEAELVGANPAPLQIVGAEVRTDVQLDEPPKARVAASLAAVSENAAPDRVFLNLENVRGLSDATVLQVYVGPAEGGSAAERLAGTVALFGVRQASLAHDDHGGSGLSYVLEISEIVDELHRDGALDRDGLQVRIVPAAPLSEAAQVRVGRVSIVRQAGGG